ncbi:Lipase chaperone [Thalassocella blandensis]|nr:Lipase chaperone [Thalassocella blandensis]
MRLLITLGLLLAGAGFIFSQLYLSTLSSTSSSAPPTTGDHRQVTRESTPITSANAAEQQTLSSDTVSAAPASLPALEGTQVPGSFSIDNQGNLILTHDTKAIFDYFLLLQGTEQYSREQVLAVIEQYLTQHLPNTALDQALQLLDRYMSYRTDLEDVMLGKQFIADKQSFQGEYQSQQLASVTQYYALIDELKNDYFDPQERDIFFSEEERYTRYMLQRMAIANEESSAQDKQKQLQALDAAQDEQFLQQRAGSESLAAIKDVTRTIKDPYAQQYALAEKFGEEKAQAIVAAEQQRSHWKDKKQQYYLLKQKLSEDHPYYSHSDINQLMDSYMATDLGFSDAEIKRMQILEGR